VIDTIEREGLLEHVTVLGQKLRVGLAADPRVTEVTGEGLLIGVVTAVDTAKIAAAALARGFILNNATTDRLRLAPPLVLTEEDAAAFLAAWPAILDAAQEA
jgi:acetylornithine aminotransferase